jgi:hypothetical protein
MNETGHSLDHRLAIRGRLLVKIMRLTTCLLFMLLFFLLPSSSCLAASSVSYTYDSVNRLEKVDYGNGTCTYSSTACNMAIDTVRVARNDIQCLGAGQWYNACGSSWAFLQCPGYPWTTDADQEISTSILPKNN